MVLVFFLAQTRSAWADCQNDSQCKGDRICEKGQCVSPPPKAAPAPPPAVAPAPVPAAPVAPPPPAAPAGPPPVRVEFEGKRDLVRLESRGVTKGECRMPCSVEVPPGEYTMHTKTIDEQITVGPSGSNVTFKQGCTACYITGPIMLGLSIPLFAGGGALADSSSSETAGIGLIASGAIFAASGLAILIIGIAVGGSKVLVNDEEVALDTHRSRPTNGIRFTGFRGQGGGAATSPLAFSF